jgi:cytoskeletal protein CcmA (bactofilin family)
MAGNRRRLTLILPAAAIWLIALTASGYATEFMGGESVYIIDSVTINDDLISGSQSTTVSGKVRGDLITMGMSTTVDGEVNGSINSFVMDFKMSGHCFNSVRTFAWRTDIDGRIERNLLAYSETVVLGRMGWVEKDVNFSANTLTMQGRIGGDLKGGGGQVYISGQIDGDVHLEAEEIVIQPSAIIGGKLTTIGKREPKIEPGAQILGETVHTPPEKKKKSGYGFGDFIIDAWSFLALALTGGVLLLLFRGFTCGVTCYIQSHWLKSLGLGFVFFICLPIAAAILIVTLIGIPMGLIVIGGWLLLFYLAKIFAALIAGEWVLKKFRGGNAPARFWSLLLGLIIIILLLKIPVLGILLKLAILFLAYGGFVLAAVEWYEQLRQKSAAATETVVD